MVSLTRAWMTLFVLIGLTLSGCDKTESIVPVDVDRPSVSPLSAAEQVGRAPVVIEVADMLLRIWGPVHSCPETFDLGNGLSGTCWYNSQGPIVNVNGSDGAPIEVSWWIYVFPVDQNGSSAVWGGEWGESATTWAGGGSSTLWLDGRIHTDGKGNVTGYDLYLGDNGKFWWQLTPSELRAWKPRALDIQIDRRAGTGTILKNGALAAHVTIQGGCTTVDFVDPALEDENGCLW